MNLRTNKLQYSKTCHACWCWIFEILVTTVFLVSPCEALDIIPPDTERFLIVLLQKGKCIRACSVVRVLEKVKGSRLEPGTTVTPLTSQERAYVSRVFQNADQEFSGVYEIRPDFPTSSRGWYMRPDSFPGTRRGKIFRSSIGSRLAFSDADGHLPYDGLILRFSDKSSEAEYELIKAQLTEEPSVGLIDGLIHSRVFPLVMLIALVVTLAVILMLLCGLVMRFPKINKCTKCLLILFILASFVWLMPYLPYLFGYTLGLGSGQRISLEDTKIERRERSIVLHGILKNSSSLYRRVSQFSIEFFDQNGQFIDKCKPGVSMVIYPGEEREFLTVCPVQCVDRGCIITELIEPETPQSFRSYKVQITSDSGWKRLPRSWGMRPLDSIPGIGKSTVKLSENRSISVPQHQKE
jgi:hypothetical protein